jgi:hypothetical protein
VKSDQPASAQHQDNLLLPYLDGTLAPELKSQVEHHLSECEHCRGELVTLRETIDLLGKTKEAFCPEPWEIYDFVRGGRPDGRISRHLHLCASCASETEAFERTRQPDALPMYLWNQIRTNLPKGSEEKSFLNRFLERFRIPSVAVAAAAAAIVVAIMFYPHPMDQSGIGLSSVTWQVMRPKALLPRVAVVLMFKDFKEPVLQARIDSLYEFLKPSMEVSERFAPISPAELAQTVKKGKIDSSSTGNIAKTLGQQLDTAYVVLVQIRPSNNDFSISVQLADSSNGHVVDSETLSGISSGELNDKVRTSVFSLLLKTPSAKR